MGFITIGCLFIITFIIVSGNVIDGGRRYDIVNGHPINITDAPFFAIYKPTEFKRGCGASIVHERFLVTACHCVHAFEPYDTEIVVGTDKIGHGTKHEINKSTCHPEFNYFDYDLAVIELKEHLNFNERVNKIEIADSNIEIKVGDVFETMGFGDTEEGGDASDILLAVNVPYVDQNECKKVYKEKKVNITERMICAGGKTEDSCQGDSGGPLHFKGKLIGDVCFGIGCARPGYPGVYGFIPAMREFVDSMIH